MDLETSHLELDLQTYMEEVWDNLLSLLTCYKDVSVSIKKYSSVFSPVG